MKYYKFLNYRDRIMGLYTSDDATIPVYAVEISKTEYNNIIQELKDNHEKPH